MIILTWINTVIGMVLHNPLILDSIVEPVDCLGIERIQNIIRNELKENIDQFEPSKYYSSGTMFFDLFELGYLRVRDSVSGNRYSYIPAWGLSDERNKSKRGIYINAIDGSVIIWDEVS